MLANVGTSKKKKTEKFFAFTYTTYTTECNLVLTIKLFLILYNLEVVMKPHRKLF